MIRVRRSPLTLLAPGLKLRVPILAEERIDAIPIRMLLTRLVREFYRPIEVIILTGATRLAGALELVEVLPLREADFLEYVVALNVM